MFPQEILLPIRNSSIFFFLKNGCYPPATPVSFLCATVTRDVHRCCLLQTATPSGGVSHSLDFATCFYVFTGVVSYEVYSLKGTTTVPVELLNCYYRLLEVIASCRGTCQGVFFHNVLHWKLGEMFYSNVVGFSRHVECIFE